MDKIIEAKFFNLEKLIEGLTEIESNEDLLGYFNMLIEQAVIKNMDKLLTIALLKILINVILCDSQRDINTIKTRIISIMEKDFRPLLIIVN